jgi:hypothetical protein
MKRFWPYLKDFSADLSLANLCFIKVWVLVLYKNDVSLGYYSGSPIPIYVAVVSDILLLATIFFTLHKLETKYPNTLITYINIACTFVAVGLVINGFKVVLDFSNLMPPDPNRYDNLIAIILIFTAGFLIVKYHQTSVRYLRVASLLFLPLFFIIVAQATVQSFKYGPLPTGNLQHSHALHQNEVRSPHIIWIIFDEMGEHIVFAERPATLKLPELDQLRRNSLSADNSLPP